MEDKLQGLTKDKCHDIRPREEAFCFSLHRANEYNKSTHTQTLYSNYNSAPIKTPKINYKVAKFHTYIVQCTILEHGA